MDANDVVAVASSQDKYCGEAVRWHGATATSHYCCVSRHICARGLHPKSNRFNKTYIWQSLNYLTTIFWEVLVQEKKNIQNEEIS